MALSSQKPQLYILLTLVLLTMLFLGASEPASVEAQETDNAPDPAVENQQICAL